MDKYWVLLEFVDEDDQCFVVGATSGKGEYPPGKPRCVTDVVVIGFQNADVGVFYDVRLPPDCVANVAAQVFTEPPFSVSEEKGRTVQ